MCIRVSGCPLDWTGSSRPLSLHLDIVFIHGFPGLTCKYVESHGWEREPDGTHRNNLKGILNKLKIPIKTKGAKPGLDNTCYTLYRKKSF